jgi:hypothetical protein
MPESVKSITLLKEDYLIADLHSEDLSVKKYKYSYSFFDERGNVLEEVKYNSDGDEEEKIIRNFDDQGHLSEEIYFAGEEEAAERRTFERDPGGKVLKEFKHYLDGSFDTVYYYYDTQGLLVKKQAVDDEGMVESTITLEYQGNRLISEKETNEGDELVSQKTFIFDEQGQPIEHTEWDGEDDKVIRVRDEFNGEGRRILSYRYENDRLVTKSAFEEDDKGRVTRVSEESEHGITELVLTYDEKGNVVVQDELDRDGEVISRVERKFGEDNRLLESIVYIDGLGRRMSQKYMIRYLYEFY